MKVNFNDHKLVSNNHGLTEIHVVWAYPPIYMIKSDFLFVVCPLRTIFGNRKGAHVHLEGLKHGNRDTRLNMVCTQ